MIKRSADLVNTKKAFGGSIFLYVTYAKQSLNATN